MEKKICELKLNEVDAVVGGTKMGISADLSAQAMRSVSAVTAVHVMPVATVSALHKR